MVVVIAVIVVVAVLAIGVVIALGVKSKSDAAEAAGVGPNEFLQTPPSSFPTLTTASVEPPSEGPADADDIVIDLVEIEIEAEAARAAVAVTGEAEAARAAAAVTGDADAASAMVLEDEPDVGDHVLQALINRARFKQVGIEEVATELVEQADQRGEDVSDLLAELVGRSDDIALDPAPRSELTLFNDAVPSRPGQLIDLARLAPADKKRLIIRVLCLLVARSEDQQLPPRDSSGSASAPRSWPLARVAWPVDVSVEGADHAQLPSRRLAKSG